jgi:hypothetical protein
MADLIRRRLLLGWAVMLVGAGVAACDSPIVAPRSVGGGAPLVATADTQAAAPVADSVSDLYANCDINNSCPTTGTVTVTEPGGNATIGTFGPGYTSTVTVGGNNYGFQLGLINGSFIGIIWKNGAFAGYWGYCLFPNAMNNWYKTTDPTGKVYIHWENHELDSNRKDTGQMYHYIYDPQTGTLKVYHRDRNGNTKLIYQGPPIQGHGKLPPPDPAGANPYTNENQWTNGVPVPAVPAGTTTTSPATPTSETATPATETETMSAATAAMVARGRHWAEGRGAPAPTP